MYRKYCYVVMVFIFVCAIISINLVNIAGAEIIQDVNSPNFYMLIRHE
jgi:hypothetical protein